MNCPVSVECDEQSPAEYLRGDDVRCDLLASQALIQVFVKKVP